MNLSIITRNKQQLYVRHEDNQTKPPHKKAKEPYKSFPSLSSSPSISHLQCHND